MSLWHPSRLVSKADFETHRTSTPIDHPDGSVTRAKLEYPTEDVSLAYLAAINKLRGLRRTAGDWVGEVTLDDFADKAVEGVGFDGQLGLSARAGSQANDVYTCLLDSDQSTADFILYKRVGGTITKIASESVDINSNSSHLLKLSCSGSALKAYREDMATEKISATDTDLASGGFGVLVAWGGGFHSQTSAMLRAPSSPLKPPLAIIETSVAGSGAQEDPFRPALVKELSPEGDKDYASVSYGLFDHKKDHATMIVMITGDNYYKSGAIDRQKETARRSFAPPRDYAEAIDLYKKLKPDYPSWLAGKDNFAYQALGWELLDYVQNADFYYGELLEHKTHYDQLKHVPSFEIERRLRELKDKLSRVEVLHEERDKHLRKVGEVLKKGW